LLIIVLANGQVLGAQHD